MPRRVVTDALDALGLLAVAGGAGAGAARWIGWFGLLVSGVLVLAGSALVDWQARPKGER